ncbi:MAG TPA: hypothetical protein VMS38_02210 [Pseudorhodoferax sp.]|nr:hypothetical protein [Pseudorhodoferax sp.]
MSTEREFQNANRDYLRQLREARPPLWRRAWDAVRGLMRQFASALRRGPATADRRAIRDRKAAIERAAKERL